MSCNNKHDFPFATTVVGEVKDSFMASVGFENGKYLKLGNVLTAVRYGSMPFCVELDNLKDTDAPIHQPAAMLVAAD